MGLAMVEMFPTPEPDEYTFDNFWCIYVRHEAKKDARRAWDHLSRSDRMAAIIGAAAWRREFLSRETRFVPLPGSWLRGERWDDELPTSHQAPAAAAHLPFSAPVETGRSEMPESVKALIAKLKR